MSVADFGGVRHQLARDLTPASPELLQGAFGAILAPSALGTLVSTFQDPRERGRAFGVFGSVAAGGGAVGLILGGALTQYLSWRYTLYVNLVFAALAIVGALVYIRSSRSATRPRMDWPGAVLACAGLFVIVFGFSHAETAGWTAAVTIGSLVVGAGVLAGFVLAELRVSHPLLPLHVILDRTRGGAYVAVFLSGIAIFGVFLFLTYYMQLIKGDSPLTTGLLFLPLIGCILISSNLSSIVLLPKVGPRALITSGMLLGVIGMIYLTRLTVTSGYVSGILPALLVMGLGFGLIFAPAINTATAGGRAGGLGRGLGASQHDAAGRRFDRDLRAQHDRADRHDQLPSGSPYRSAGAGRRSRPRLHAGLYGVGGAVRAGRDPGHHPAAVPPPARGTQERSRGRRTRPDRRATRPRTGIRPRARHGTRIRARRRTRRRDARGDARDSRGLALLLAGDQP